MNFSAFGARSGSPAVNSRAESPIPKLPDDASSKNDKATRRYASIVEKTLATWEIAPEEWADYIAFLSRLLRAIQSAPTGSSSLPHSDSVATKLAQCLNPSLPSGVHQKALEVYAIIFTTFGQDHVSSHLHEYLPGLFPLLSFAALSIRPLLYDILEDHIVCLSPAQLRPVLKSFILSILPALEDETSEDFDRALTTITRLEHTFTQGHASDDNAGFYWQSVFLSIITSPSRRHGALNYLVRRLPKYVQHGTQDQGHEFAPEVEVTISPEPGLLMRAFACGLSDTQMLIQRGFLDVLTNHLPLSSPLLQHRVEGKDFQLLLSATMSVLLRRDMSLNRRVWQWFLGPEAKEETNEQATAGRQLEYIAEYGISRIENSLLTAFASEATRPSERVKPFRIGLSLMDRWEVGGSIVPKIFLPALTCAYKYSMQATTAEMADFMKSANLFFDGVESKLIWSRLYLLLCSSDDEADGSINQRIQMLLWVLNTFNVREEEMTTTHAPLLALYALDQLLAGTESGTSEWCNLLKALISITSEKAFMLKESEGSTSTNLPGTKDTQSAISAYFLDPEGNIAAPYDRLLLSNLLLRRATAALEAAMKVRLHVDVCSTASIYVQLLYKIPQPSATSVERLLSCTREYLRPPHDNVPFEVWPAIMSLMGAIIALPQGSIADIRATFVQLEGTIAPVLLTNISPERSKFNIEATRLLWRLETWLDNECAVQATVQGLVTNADSSFRRGNIRTFLNLWNLSVVQQPGTVRSPMPGVVRRVSNSVPVPEHDKTTNRAQTLSSALMTVLETLGRPHDVAFEDVSIWLNSSAHTDTALLVLFERLRDALDMGQRRQPSRNVKIDVRQHNDGRRALLYVLQHFDHILQHAKATFWAVLTNTQLPGSKSDARHLALAALVEQCLMLLPGKDDHPPEIHHLAISILGRLLGAPPFVQAAIRIPELGTIIAKQLLAGVVRGDSEVQGSMLELTAKALSLQRLAARHATLPPRVASHTRKMSLVAASLDTVDESSATQRLPTQLLVQLLKTGFSSPNCFAYLDSWLQFAEEVLPMIGTALTSVLIPLTEVVCARVELVVDEMVSSSSSGSSTNLYAPEATISKLLDSLEIFLRGAHSILLQEEQDVEHTQPDTNGTVLSNMTPNMFKSQGHPSKTAKANSRLTAILACKDVVRVCIKIWLWASSSAEGNDVDRHSAATTSYHAVRLRNRARHMLEEMFSLEPLESLEVVVVHWTSADSESQKDTVISLLHVLRDLRPKNTVPAILDALCSRTNPALLVPARQSTLTSALTSIDLVLFYSAYLASLEDDALEEVWSDCTAFLRDVLSNPLPHRQVLPALIWVIYQLAQKLENTNYGERKRMKRELGDNFQRLLAATFAALPSSNIETADVALETPFSLGLKSMNLVVILREVIGRADLILETSDRVAACISTVSTSLITPTLRSKTFPVKVDADILALLLRVAKKSPGAKAWRRDVADAFNDPRFVATAPALVEGPWLPILQQWCLTDKERMHEIIGRLYAPTAAGIMFGVGATAARLDADRKTQFNLRRISLLLMACSTDSHVEHLKAMQEKMVELFEASTVSSPSSAIKAELFMLVRSLLLSTSPVHFAPLWPTVNDNLQAALRSMNADPGQDTGQNNLSLLQACKLLDLLAAVSPDEFQLYEWLYLTNTTDAVYHHPDWTPTALSDSLGVSQSGQPQDDESEKEHSDLGSLQVPGSRRPLLVKGAGFDTEDLKAMAREGFVNTTLRPFLSQLSINLYESRYRLDKVDVSAFRHILIEDLQDSGTIST